MTNSNYLKQYLELRGLTCQDLAIAIGLGYHCVQKTVKGHKHGVRTRAAIADYLGLDPIKTWGRGSVIYLRRMVAVEANKVADQKAAKTKNDFLAKYNGNGSGLHCKASTVNV